MECAVNRKTVGGRILGEHQKISPLSALRAQTIDAAWQVFKENERGSIEQGKRADFAILSANPLTWDTEKLNEIRVVQTIRYGRCVGLPN
jgi:predicted amidohydrolase YtcJ